MLSFLWPQVSQVSGLFPEVRVPPAMQSRAEADQAENDEGSWTGLGGMSPLDVWCLCELRVSRGLLPNF